MGDASRPTAEGGLSPNPALSRLSELLPLVYESDPEGILLASADGSILAANPAACRILGRTEEEICHIGRSGILDPADPALAAALEGERRTGCLKGGLTALRPDGSRVSLQVSSASLGAGGAPGPLALF